MLFVYKKSLQPVLQLLQCIILYVFRITEIVWNGDYQKKIKHHQCSASHCLRVHQESQGTISINHYPSTMFRSLLKYKKKNATAFICLCVYVCSCVLGRSFLNSCHTFPLGAVWSLMSGDSPFSGWDSFLMPLVIWNSFNCTKLPLHLEWRSAMGFSSHFENLNWSDGTTLMVIFCPVWVPWKRFTVAVFLHTHQPTALSYTKSLDCSLLL